MYKSIFRKLCKLYKLCKLLITDFPYYNFSFSQDGEDRLLWEMMGEATKKKGFYVDIGAFHPSRFSNTKIFYDNNWKGINIDATPGSMDLFKKHRKRDINLEVGVSNEENELKYYMFNEKALNTFSKQRAARIKRNEKYKLVKVETVKTMKLSTILDMYLPPNTEIDFIDIDVESLDYEILLSNDWDRYSPNYVLIELAECSNMENALETDIYKFLKSKNYSLCAKTLRTFIFEKNK